MDVAELQPYVVGGPVQHDTDALHDHDRRHEQDKDDRADTLHSPKRSSGNARRRTIQRVRRRELLLSLAALVGAACVKPPERPAEAPQASLPPDFDSWQREAHAILSDALDTLRTFDIFLAYRATSPGSNSRMPNDLDWDPPTSAAWNEATHVSQGLSGRAAQLFQAVSTARIDASLWREQRQAAENVHTLLDLGAALATFRGRVDALTPGDASSATGLLDQVWTRWTDAAGAWGVSRSEAIGCGTL
ncbi:MAG: hypothetical protein JOZ81_01585 [Chloroflexi bacterium]|nr:hypothetical protein [Chloroflexota bacterium]